MKKLLLVLLVLPLRLVAMDHRKYTIPTYPEFENPNVYMNRNTKLPCNRGVNCLLDILFRDAKILTWKDVEFANRQLSGGNLIHLYQENTGNTLLHEIAFCKGEEDTLNYLRELGFDLNYTNKNGKTVFTLVAESNNEESEKKAPSTRSEEKPEEYFISPVMSNNDYNIPEEKDNLDKSESWYVYATLKNGMLSMVCLIVAGYFYKRFVAKTNEDSMMSNY